MKILIVSPTPVFPIRSGFTEIIYQISRELGRRGHDVTVFSFQRDVGEVGIQPEKSGIKNKILPTALINLLNLLNWNILKMNLNPFFLYRLIKIIRSENFDVIQSEGFWTAPMTCLAAKMTSKRCIIHDYNVPTFPTNEYTRPMQILGKLFVYIGMKLSKIVTVTMEEERHFLIKSGYEESKIVVLPHGVDTGKFKEKINPLKIKSEFGLHESCHIVVFIGDFSWGPNVNAAKRIAEDIVPVVNKEIRDVKFLLIGGSPPIQYSSPCIIYTGWKDSGSKKQKIDESIVTYLKASDIGIAPLDSGGGISVKVLEYMAAGIPVVSTSFGVRGIKAEHDKHTLIADDYNVFAEYIIDLLRNKEKRISIGDAGRRLVEALYSWTTIVDMLEKEYEKVVS